LDQDTALACPRQREWVREELAKHELDFEQFTFDFGEQERRRLESDMRCSRNHAATRTTQRYDRWRDESGS